MAWFGRRVEQQGKTCPLCETLNPEDAGECSQCYYLLDKSSREQEVAMGSGEENNLLDELLTETEETEEDESIPVDVITMDDMTVEVGQYELVGDDEEVEDKFTYINSAGPTFAEVESEGDGPIEEAPTATLESMPGVAAPEPEPLHGELQEELVVDEEEGEIDLLTLPELPTVEAPPPIDRSEFPTPQVEEELPDLMDEEELPLPSPPAGVALPEEVEIGGEQEATPLAFEEEAKWADEPSQSTEPSSPSRSVPPSAVAPLPQPSGGVALPNGSVSGGVALPAVVDSAEVAQTRSTPAQPPPAEAFSPVVEEDGNIWPWTAQEEWDYRDLYRELKDAMEATQRGALPVAAESLDRLGPHLGNRVDLIYYVGQILKSLGRDKDLETMLSRAKDTYPGDQSVSSAVHHLGPV